MLIFYTTFIDEEKEKTKFECIYEKYHRLMLKVAYEILKDQMRAEDAVHNSFLKIIKHLDKLEMENEYATKYFVLQTVRNAALDIYRKIKRETTEHVSFDDLTEWKMPRDQRSDMEYDTVSEENRIILAIRSMPESYQNIFILKYSAGYANHEIAKRLGISEENVRQRISRGKKILKQILEERGISVR